MALTPWLAAGGQLIASRFELHDVRSLLPVESEVKIIVLHFNDLWFSKYYLVYGYSLLIRTG